MYKYNYNHLLLWNNKSFINLWGWIAGGGEDAGGNIKQFVINIYFLIACCIENFSIFVNTQWAERKQGSEEFEAMALEPKIGGII